MHITSGLDLRRVTLGWNVGVGSRHTPCSYCRCYRVIALMVIIAVVELWYFRSKGWFE